MINTPIYRAFRLYHKLAERAEYCRRFAFPHPLQTPEPRDQINYGWWAHRMQRYEYWAGIARRCMDNQEVSP